MSRRYWPALTIVLTCAALASCGEGPVLDEGGCSARVLIHGETYRPAGGLQTPQRGESLGSAAYADCEGTPVTAMGGVEAFAVSDHDPSQLVIVAEENGDVVYLNNAVPWSDRPQLVKDSDRYLTCSGPARFTGIWRWVDPEDMPNGEDYASAQVPYTANFSATQGTGISLDRWSRVTFQAEVTSDTRPVPSARFLRRATSGHVPVAVTAVCRAESFELATIRFAR